MTSFGPSLSFVVSRCVAWLGCFAVLYYTPSVTAQSLQVGCTDGNVYSVSNIRGRLDWLNIADDGVVTQQQIPWSDINALTLISSDESARSVKVRRLLSQLGDTSYQKREAAEKELRKPAVSVGFIKMIETFSDHPNFEIRYRVERILLELPSDEEQQTPDKYDTVNLVDGRFLQGDAKDFQLSGNFRGRAISIPRSAIRVIQSIADEATQIAKVQPKPFEIELLYQREEWERADKIELDFSEDDLGAELLRNEDINERFLKHGIRFSTEGEGYIGISGWNMVFRGSKVGKNSIAVFDKTNSTDAKRFKGVMTIDFCVPYQPSMVAGVHEFGTYIAKVDEGRDFIFECYDENGELVTTVESPNAPCGYVGFKSSIPITRIRILSNPYLFRIDRTVDDDYGIDTLRFSKPVPVFPKASTFDQVRLRDGGILLGNDLAILDDGESVSISTPITGNVIIPVKDIVQIGFGRPVKKVSRKWLAELDDGSTVMVTPKSKGKFVSSLLGTSFDSSDFVSFHHSAGPKRLPLSKDFQAKKPVLSFPTCRILADDFQFDASGFSWNKKSAKILQPVDTKNPLGIDGEDPTPNETEINFKNISKELLPTVWFKPPISIADSGLIKTNDGHEFVLGKRFTLKSINSKEITLQHDDKSFVIDMKNVERIRWPAK